MGRRAKHVMITGPFLGSEAIAEGALTPAQLRGPMVRRLFRGVYLPAGMQVTHAVRAEAATLLMPTDAVITGRSAAAVRGVNLAAAHDPVEVHVPERSRFGPIEGMTIVRTLLRPCDSRPWENASLAEPARMAFDLARARSLPNAVADLDAILRAGLVDRSAMHRHMTGLRKHGVVNARDAVRLADPRAESRPESLVRCYLNLADLWPQPQLAVTAPSGRTMRVDLGFEQLKIAVEYDGGWHVLREQLERDRVRLNDLRAAGWVIIHVTATQLGDPQWIVRQVQAAMAAARTAA